MITYKRTSQGEWVAYAPVSEFRTDDGALRCRIEITKKSGETKVAYLDHLGRTFTVNGTDYCYGYLAIEAKPRKTARRRVRGYDDDFNQVDYGY